MYNIKKMRLGEILDYVIINYNTFDILESLEDDCAIVDYLEDNNYHIFDNNELDNYLTKKFNEESYCQNEYMLNIFEKYLESKLDVYKYELLDLLGGV